MNFREFLKNNIVYLDGAVATPLQQRGLLPGEQPEKWNVTHPEEIVKLHKSYFDIGCNVVYTNTFGANTLNFSENELSDIIFSAVSNAKKALTESNAPQQKFISLDVGPTGKLLGPAGDMDFEEAVSVFKYTVELGVKAGVDLISLETFNDCLETKAALLAVKEVCDLPVIVTNAYNEDEKLLSGTSPEAMVAMLEGMGADAIGLNCSFGPEELLSVCRRILKVCSVPVVFKPNAGLPEIVDGKTVYSVSFKNFAESIKIAVDEGAGIIGGCCGTTPDFLKEVITLTKNENPSYVSEKNITVISSKYDVVNFGKKPILIGERINPTGKKRFKQALLDNDFGYILNEGIGQQEKGVHVLDVNVGTPGIDEVYMLTEAVNRLQSVVTLPLQIDTSNVGAMESAMRVYNGKPLINSVNGSQKSMEQIFPLVKKYGGVLVALTMDENGIPDTVSERFEIAEKILNKAQTYGIKPKDIIFDALTMAVSASGESFDITLETMKKIRRELGCHTCLGVSNISFGLPSRDFINGTFFAIALYNGLSAAIMNPYSNEMMKTYYSFNALSSLDEGFDEYIGFAGCENSKSKTEIKSDTMSLETAICKGLCEQSEKCTEELLKTETPQNIINNFIIPALNKVGEDFEKNIIFLPQLLMSAESAKAGFEVIKKHFPSRRPDKCRVVLATVEGDVHDIGKNIVKLLLENYGFDVVDLGSNVSPEKILSEAKKEPTPLVGLSALMTTTLPAMEKTIELVHRELPGCKIAVGGAVLTEDYAEKIGADRYCADATETVRYAEEINGLI